MLKSWPFPAQGMELGIWIFTKGLSLVYLIAFLSLLVQVKGLYGQQGILPIENLMSQAQQHFSGIDRLLKFPTLFWMGSPDAALMALAVLGATAALLAFLGVFTGPALFFCWVSYLSFTTVGQDFLSFQWDSLLLEVGFAALFVSPWTNEWLGLRAPTPSWIGVLLLHWILFRLMFSAGVVKLTSGDESWRDFTALNYHYFTQPLPNPISFFLHQMPGQFQKASTAMMFFIELVVPFAIFIPQLRTTAFVLIAGLQLLFIATGNFAFFNLLALALCFPLLTNKTLEGWIPVSPEGSLSLGLGSLTTPWALLSVFLGTLWILDALRFQVLSENSWNRSIARAVAPFQWVNPYGLFAVMTKDRPEIVIEGSNDGQNWKPYGFRYKVSDNRDRPPLVAPHQPRLDWQMWFAAMTTFERQPWVQNLLIRILQGEPSVLNLLSTNPFPEKSPLHVRARLYHFEFSSPSQLWKEGNWWNSRLTGEYSPVLSRME